MRGVIATGDVDPRALVDARAGVTPMEGSDLVLGVTCERAVRLEARDQPVRRVRAAAAAAARAGR